MRSHSDLHNPTDVPELRFLLLHPLLRRQPLLSRHPDLGLRHEEESEVVRGDGKAVHDVHCALEEAEFAGRACEPQQILDGEV